MSRSRSPSRTAGPTGFASAALSRLGEDSLDANRVVATPPGLAPRLVRKLPKECLARADQLSKSLRDAVAAALRAAAKVKRISDEIEKFETSSQLPPSWPKHKLLFETAEHQIPVPYELQSFQVPFPPGTPIKDTLRLLHSSVAAFSKKESETSLGQSPIHCEDDWRC